MTDDRGSWPEPLIWPSSSSGSLQQEPFGRRIPVDLAALRRPSVARAAGRPGPTDLTWSQKAWRRRPTRPGGLGRPALLRVRHRWQPAGGARRRLADLGLGPERRPLRHLAGGRRGRGGRGRLAGRAARPARRDERRLRDRGHDGQLHGARRGPSRRPGKGRLGCRAPGPAKGAPPRQPHHSRRGPTSRSTPRSRCSAWAARASACGGSRPTSRAGCARMPRAKLTTIDGAGHRVQPGRQCEHRAPSIRSTS